MLELASAETQLALVELRDAAHGIFPPILADAGLDPALRSLAERSPVPIEFAHLTTARFPNQIESAAYLVVAAAAEDAGRRGVEWVAVDIREHDGCLVVDATCRGDPGAPAVEMNVHDRIGAAGGRIVTSARGIRAELPCVS